MATRTSSSVLGTCYYSLHSDRRWAGRWLVQLDRRIWLGSLREEVRRSRSALVCKITSEGGNGKPDKGRRKKTAGEKEEQAQPVKKTRSRKKKAETNSADETTKVARSQQVGEDEVENRKKREQAAKSKQRTPSRRRKTELAAPQVQSAATPQVVQVEAEVFSAADEKEEEDEEEEEEEEEEDDEYEEAEGSDNNDEVKFPEAECYALVSTYKKCEAPKSLSNKEVWWNWRKPNEDEHFWSEFQKRQPEPNITLAAMSALTGQIKLFGDTPTVTEARIYRARKRVFYEERLAAEEQRRKEIGSMAYYQEWVKAWKKDTSLQAVQKHFEETGEDASVQLQEMLSHQTRAEFRHMMGTDIRIRRDPLVMRATKEQKRTVFGGDPVYPTINYIRDPEEVVDYRGPNFHEPRMTVCEYLMKCGTMKSREQHNALLALEKQRLQEEDEEDGGQSLDNLLDEEVMAAAVDIGDKEDEDEDVHGDVEVDEEDEAGEDDDDAVFKDEDIEIVTSDQLAQLVTDDEEAANDS